MAKLVARQWKALVELAGVVSVVAGIAMVSVPVALVVAGLTAVAAVEVRA